MAKYHRLTDLERAAKAVQDPEIRRMLMEVLDAAVAQEAAEKDAAEKSDDDAAAE